MFDPSGNAVARYLYDPYGNLIASTGPLAEANLYRFSSKEYDPRTGLYDFGFRWYDPNLQRWLTQDPIGELGGINLYVYVGNKPLLYVDPYGLAWYDWEWIDTAGSWGAGVGDALSFGLTDWGRDLFDLNEVIDRDSAAYTVGEWTGIGVGIALGGVGGFCRSAGKEFSHWIPDRALRRTDSRFIRNTFGRSPFNGNYVSPARHFKHDPFRFPGGDLGRKFPWWLQQFDRIPTIYGSAVYAGQGAYVGANE